MKNEYADIFEMRGSSYNEANRRCPMARERERMLLIDRLDLQSGQTLLDVSAGGGYLSEKAHALWGPTIQIWAIEPSDVFASALPEYIRRIPKASVTDFRLPDQCVQRVANLSGLHHVRPVSRFFQEVYRVLVPGGRLAVADVRKGSTVDRWLNGFVHTHSLTGHQGAFFKPGAFRSLMAAAGFTGIDEQARCYEWEFGSINEMVSFCTILFGIDHADPRLVLRGIDDVLGYAVDASDGRVRMNWELLFAGGVRF